MSERIQMICEFLLTALTPFAMIFGVAIFVVGAATLFRKIKNQTK